MSDTANVGGFTCATCGEEYKQLSSHYAKNPSHRPVISGEVMDVLRGLLMGDATLNTQSQYPRLEIGVTEKRYLEDLQQSYPRIFNSITHQPRGGHASDFYTMPTVPHPQFFEFKNWYSSGEKVFPSDVNLTPTVLKHWYCTDGGLRWPSNGGNGNACIYCKSQDLDQIKRYFDDTPFDPNMTGSDTIYFDSDDTPKLLGWMGPPPDGFRYKWEWCDKDAYQRKKQTTPITDEHLSGLSEQLVHVARRLDSIEPTQMQQERFKEYQEKSEKEFERRVDDAVEQKKNELRSEFEKEKIELRNQIIREIYDELSDFDEKQQRIVDRFGGVSQTMIAEAVDLSQQSISKITD